MTVRRQTESFALIIIVALAAFLPTSGTANAQIAQPELVMPERFATLDTDADGSVDFAEFSAFAAGQDVPRIRAASAFTRLSAGDALISPADFLYGVKVEDSPTWTEGYEIGPYDLEGEYFGEILSVTPNEEVAGEVIIRDEDVIERDRDWATGL